jgi:dephospho-CoA kinase
MKTIGLVGGIASGKSLVADMLAELGATVLNADRIGHDVLAEDSLVQEAMRERWGAEVFGADGEVNRKAIAQRVFAPGASGEADRKFLEALMHPKIREALASGRNSHAEAGTNVVVIDAALLFEAGWNYVCDLVAFVDAPREIRLERAKKRGWTDEQFVAREAAQWPVQRKRERADVVIANAGSIDELRQDVQVFWDKCVAS